MPFQIELKKKLSLREEKKEARKSPALAKKLF